MDFQDSPEEARYRSEVSAWLAKNAIDYRKPQTPHTEEQYVARVKQWQRLKADAGYGAIRVASEHGGGGGSPMESVIFEEEEGRYFVPVGPLIKIGVRTALAAILAHGSPEIIEEFVRPTIRGDLLWCQLFSEPGAGSDLAGLRTRALKQGDNWVINGQKVWSSWAHHADWGILLARTDPTVAKHKGITFFLLDMRTPGVEIRPIRQLSGKSDFNEVFLTDVVIPDRYRIGVAGQGWNCALTALMNERLGDSEPATGVTVQSLVNRAMTLTDDRGVPMIDRSDVRERLAHWYAQEQGLRYFRFRMLTQLAKGGTPGPEAALAKLVLATKQQETSAAAMDMQGFSGLFEGDETDGARKFLDAYDWAAAWRIAGGADEILRTQIAERVLGLPGDLRVDKNVAFQDIPVGR